MRPDLRPVPVRGNAGTRLAKVASGEVDAVVLAYAGLARIGRLDAVTQVFEPDEMLPAPGQGALAVECRSGRPELVALLACADDAASRAAITAERSHLAEIPAGCSAPAAGHAAEKADGRVAFVGAGPGDEGLLTVRAAELLARADLVVAGPELAARLGRLVRPEAATADTDALAQDPRLLVKAARAGQHVVRLFSGDPFLFGHAGAEAAACSKGRVQFRGGPGVSAATPVPAYAGIPPTSDASSDVRIIHASEATRGQAGPGTLV